MRWFARGVARAVLRPLIASHLVYGVDAAVGHEVAGGAGQLRFEWMLEARVYVHVLGGLKDAGVYFLNGGLSDDSALCEFHCALSLSIVVSHVRARAFPQLRKHLVCN